MAEHQSERVGASYVRKSDDGYGLHAPQPDVDASDPLRLLDVFSKAVVDRFKRLELENAQLRGRLDALTQIVAGDKKRRKRNV